MGRSRWGPPLLGHWSSERWFPATLTTSVLSGVDFAAFRRPSVGGSHCVYIWTCGLSYPPKTHTDKGKEKWWRTQPRKCMSFFFLFQFPVPLEHPLVRPRSRGNAWSFSLYPPPALIPSFVQGAGGLWRVIASRCPCTSFSVWTPGLWTGLGPTSSESGPGAWCQTSWQICSCRSDAGQNGLGQPSETPGSSGDVRDKNN